MEGNTIKNEWETYYKQLENIRQSGITNMYEAQPYLQGLNPGMSSKEAIDILRNWMNNYDELSEKYAWR